MDDDPVNELRSVGLTAGAAISRTAETILRNMQERARQQQATTQQATDDAQRRVEAQAKIAENHFRAASDPRWADKATPAEQGQTWKAAQQWKTIDPDRFAAHTDQLTVNVRARYGDQLGQTIDRLGTDGYHLSADLIELSARRRQEAQAERTQESSDRDEASREQDRAGQEQQDRDDATSPEREQQSDKRAEESGDREGKTGEEADLHRDRAGGLDGNAETLDGQAANEQGSTYDTFERRVHDNQEMQDAGVPDQARSAKMTADHGNGADPRTAARSGTRQRSSTRSTGKASVRARTTNRGR